MSSVPPEYATGQKSAYLGIFTRYVFSQHSLSF